MYTRPSLELLKKTNDLVGRCGGIELAAARLGVHPSTLRKMTSGASLSTFTIRKLTVRLTAVTSSDQPKYPSDAPIQRLRDAYALYESLGTLEAVGRRLGVTRERVRQLLAKGTRLGLFKYSGREHLYVPREQLLNAYRRSGSTRKAAQLCGVSPQHYRRLLTAHSIGAGHLLRIRQLRAKCRCIRLYQLMTSQLGHRPTTTEMQSTSAGHSLYATINRLWGSINAFREELSVPAPPKGTRHFRDTLQTP